MRATLREHRVFFNKSLVEIAAVLDVCRQMVSHYERGIHKVPPRHLQTLATFYGIPLDDLDPIPNPVYLDRRKTRTDYRKHTCSA